MTLHTNRRSTDTEATDETVTEHWEAWSPYISATAVADGLPGELSQVLVELRYSQVGIDDLPSKGA
ncbi:hypothetical protein A8144_11410 [Mycobacterium leprae 3125609]|nr:hypothetical protein A8144_11410 [Mycobacterium leprae 3125609]OAX70624.1 hypothetical protein A3216_10900 [Mycobacterium leprae 7935681]